MKILQKVLTLGGLLVCAAFWLLYEQEIATNVWQVLPYPQWYQVCFLAICTCALLSSLVYELVLRVGLFDGLLSASLKLAMPVSVHLVFNGMSKIFDVNYITNLYGYIYVVVGVLTFVESFTHIRNFTENSQIHSVTAKAMAFAAFAILLNKLHVKFDWLLLFEVVLATAISVRALSNDLLKEGVTRTDVSYANAEPFHFNMVDAYYALRLITWFLALAVIVVRFVVRSEELNFSDVLVYMADFMMFAVGFYK